MKAALCLIVVFLISNFVEAKNIVSFELKTVAELKTLSPTDQKIYLDAVRTLIVDLEMEEKGQVQVFSWLPVAVAAGNEVCLYAGNFSVRGPSGLCSRPQSTVCSKNQVECNSLLFGPGVCVSQSTSSSQKCRSSARSMDKIMAYIQEHQSEWDDYRKRFADFCKSSANSPMCDMYLRRIADINAAIDGQAAAIMTTQESSDNGEEKKAEVKKPHCPALDLLVDAKCDFKSKGDILVEPSKLQSLVCDGQNFTDAEWNEYKEKLALAKKCAVNTASKGQAIEQKWAQDALKTLEQTEKSLEECRKAKPQTIPRNNIRVDIADWVYTVHGDKHVTTVTARTLMNHLKNRPEGFCAFAFRAEPKIKSKTTGRGYIPAPLRDFENEKLIRGRR